MKNNEKSNFDKILVHIYDENIPNLLKKSIKLKNQKKFNILDLGCGDGRLLYSLKLNNLLTNSKRIMGIDKSDIRIEKFKKILPESESKISDVCNLDFLENDLFDIVISSQVIEHVSDDNLMLNEIRRIFKPDGIAYISSVIKKKYGFYIYRINGKFCLDPTHLREYSSKEEFLNLIKKNKLKIIDLEIKQVKYSFIELISRILAKIGILTLSSIQNIYVDKKWMTITKKINIPIIGYQTIEVLCKK
jgi:2-polyprenyl-3-methyl-5-hydroxy-6-metoxy-1,4-benzoquinol methylase